MEESTTYQDKLSSILLNKNIQGSSSKNTWHININYLFVSDKLKSSKVAVEYFLTKEKITNFLTKPLHGTKFCKFRDLVLNIQD